MEYVHPELNNLAAELDEEELAKIGAECHEDFTKDAESRTEWMKMHSEWMRIYFLKDKPKSAPWPGSSEESIPMLAEGCNQYHARSYQAMFPTRNIIRCIPVGKVDSKSKDRAQRVGTHMSWQLTVKDRTYKKNKDRLLLAQPLHGCVFTKTYYDPVTNSNVIRNVRAVDLVLPYGVGPRDLEDIDRKSEIIWISLDYAKYLESVGYFSNVPDAWNESDSTDADKTHDELQGLSQPGYENKNYARIIEQHRLLDLDEDGLREPYIVTFDSTSKKVLRIAIRYDTDEAGNPTNDKRPVEYYTQYNFMENPDGVYGLGFGHLIGPLNTAVNKMLRQHIDAATLANVGNFSGIISKQIPIKKGELEFQLGKFITTEASVDDLAKGIFQFKFPGPQPTLPQMIELIMARSDRLATVTEAVTGQTDKVMQPTTVMALLEQSQQLFSAVYERTLEAWERELQKIYRLNGKFLDPEEYFSVLDISGELKDVMVARDDYSSDMQVVPIADPKMTTQRQKLAKADAEWQFLLNNPLVQQSPMHLYNASRRYLEAIEADNIDEVLPKPQLMLPPINDPVRENMGAMLPTPIIPEPAPGQDHIFHIKVHQGLLTDPDYGPHISDIGRSGLMDHIKAHVALMYGDLESGLGAMNEQAGPGSIPGMVPQPGNEMGATGGQPGISMPMGTSTNPGATEALPGA